MSRLTRYAHSLASGYVTLGANVAFTLASVPLALSYLSKAEFGLWALTTQLAGYLALVDMGLTGAASRILIDYKDEPAGTNYGSVILTSGLVGLSQAAVLLGAGVILLLLLGSAAPVPGELQHAFRGLMLGQCVLLAVGCLTRVFGNLLWAHQRLDVGNYSQMLGFGANFGVMWLGFARGGGVFSLLWGQLAGAAVVALVTWRACARLKLFPRRGRWGRPTWGRFKELFAFGKDVFLFTLGGQMVNTSQTILIAPCLGLDAAGVWAVCVRSYALLCQLIWRILDYSATPLSELFVSGQKGLLLERFRGVTILTAVAATAGAVVFALCNQPFVALWTQGKVGWSRWNDVLLGIWAVLVAVQRCHCGLLGVVKDLGTVKYVYFVEGLLFTEAALVIGLDGGFAGLIGSSIVATFCCSYLFGHWQTKRRFGLRWLEVAGWQAPAVRVGLLLLPLGLAMLWVASLLPAPAGFALLAFATSGASLWLTCRHGIEAMMRQELLARSPAWLKWLFAPA